MRAVNLIPADARRSSAPAGRSGGAAHAVLGVLALAVVALAVLTLSGRQAAERRAEAARVQAQAQAIEARAGLLGPYREFADLARTRTQRVRDLAAGRVDWSFTLTEIARVLPRGVRLVGLTATAAPGSITGGGGAAALRAAMPGPAIEMTGCTPGQDRTALLLARLRAVDGVQRVALASSEKGDAAAAAAASGTTQTAESAAGGDDCRQGSNRIPKFELVVALRPLAVTPPAAGTTGAAAAPGATAPAQGQQAPQPAATPAPETAQ